MNAAPLVSVIIPLYNKADTISRTLSSLVTQTYKNFEVIVVDDGSKDMGGDVVRAFGKIASLRYLRQENAGVSAARNRGAAEAKGEYICFLDADDEYLPDFLEEVVALQVAFPGLEAYATDFLHSSAFNKDALQARGEVSRYRIGCLDFPCFQKPRFHLCSMMIEKRAFEAVGGFALGHRNFEDYEMILKLALRACFALSSRRLFRYNEDSSERASLKPVPYENYHHWKLLEDECREDGDGRLKKFAAREILPTLVFNYRKKRYEANARVAELYPRMLKSTGVLGRLLLKRSVLGYFAAKILKKRLGL